MTFKHKITGTQAKLAEDGKYYIHNCSIGIPKPFIEDSRMWLKEDGFGQDIYVVDTERWRIYKGNLGITFTENMWDNYRFSNREEAEDYILMNNPKYSLNDIRNVLTKQMECTNWVMIDVDNIIKDLEKQ